ncbi:GNAT family N-acetyltransferase [Roseovarius aestuariivivens]|uniref:GNAT family N-acetyltransferase n=1 Tax=Roseovarius aestuariivivens TaxID=1888910 RepID=UPI00108032C9|nr:GNAT family N-acetyltransferase [Roseovarius aestuariivivens]
MTKLTLAGPDDLDRVLRLVSDFHAEQNIAQDDAARRAALTPLLDGSPHGCIYLAGPARAPIGYVVISFGWSIEYGGLDAILDEIYIRSGVRGRGIGSEILASLPKALGAAGVKALHLEVDREDDRARTFYGKQRFAARERYLLMSRTL